MNNQNWIRDYSYIIKQKGPILEAAKEIRAREISGSGRLQYEVAEFGKVLSWKPLSELTDKELLDFFWKNEDLENFLEKGIIELV